MTFTSLPLRILNAYHPQLSTLLEYVVNLVSPNPSEESRRFHDALLMQDDPTSFRIFLTKSYVAESPDVDQTHSRRIRPTVAPSMMNMLELIDRAQTILFTNKRKGRPSNIITSGYRFGGFKPDGGKGASGSRGGVTNFFVNTIIPALQTADWTRLLSRVGDAVMLHLLSETCIYVPLPNECFCQITGPHLIYMIPPKRLPPVKETGEENHSAVCEGENALKRKGEDVEPSTRPLKRLKTANSVVSDTLLGKGSKKRVILPKTKSAADIQFARLSMFYSRPCRKSSNGLIFFGLPYHHVLNKMNTPLWKKEKGILPDGDETIKPGDRDGSFEARHLSKYVFPSQYRLKSVQTIPSEKLRDEVFERRWMADREEELKVLGPCKSPPRLKEAIPLLRQLHRRHSRCGYLPLLDRICPSRLKPSHKDASIDSSVILELIAEESTQDLLKTQASEKSILGNISNISTSLRRISLPKPHANHKPKFAEFMCSHTQVFLYVREVTKAVIPNEFWGCYRNRRTILHHLKQFISGRRYEIMTLHGAMQGISTSECDWSLPSRKPGQQYHHNAVESLKRRELLEEFIFWYFDQFVIPLLKTTFYITESSAFRKRVLYFRHDDWDVLCRPLLDRLASTTFQRITKAEADELLKTRKLGYSFVRLLPKDSGVRPIVNLRRKATKSGNPYEQNQSINQILSAAFSILTYEKECQSDLLGASVFGPNEIYHKLRDFKSQLLKHNGKMLISRPKLYFVKLDVQACFDTIEQAKLLGILKSLISEDAYLVHKHGQIVYSRGKVNRLFKRKGMPEPDHPDFLQYASQLAALLHQTIFVDQVVYPIAYCDEIVELLEDHITSNLVKIGQDYYRQHVGIPQGSVLSSLLCSFFYGDLERTSLRHLREKENNLLLRLIDDYLFVTTDEHDAKTFLETMKQGHPEYGCFISKEKTLMNFGYGDADISQLNSGCLLHPNQRHLPWCGYLIDTKDLSVMTDYSRFHENYLTDSLTVERGRHVYSAFAQKTIQAATAKIHPVYTDTVLNPLRVVYRNVHQAFVLAAMKMHAYIKATGKGQTGNLATVPCRKLPSGALNQCGTGIRGNKGHRKMVNRFKSDPGDTLLLGTINQSIRYTYLMIKNKLKERDRDPSVCEPGKTAAINTNAIKWLGAHAFFKVLSRKRTAYTHTGVLRTLQQDMHRPCYRQVRRMIGKLADESLEVILKNIRF